MPRERPNIALNPVEQACERQEAQQDRVRSLRPDRDLTWESTEDFTNMGFDNDGNYYD